MENQDKSDDTFEPGAVDKDQHGWAEDAPSHGEAKERVKQAGRRAFEGRDTQDASRGDNAPPDFPDNVGESMSRRGEDMVDHEGKERGRVDAGVKGESRRPVGKSTPANTTGVRPTGPTDDES
ncbi:MAG: hypothetical protein WCA46_09890 [Actinocatenispora sp.]